MSRRAPILACAALLLLVPRTGDAQLCVGDGNSDGTVAIDELVMGVNIALERQGLGLCPGFDGNDGDLLSEALIDALQRLDPRCPPPP